MKKILFLLVFLYSHLHTADNTKHILILHSYSQEYKWTQLQHTGFVSTLEESFPSSVDISVEYLDTKRHDFSDKYQSFFLNYLQEKYEGVHFDAIYVTDDNALNFFNKSKNNLLTDTPIFFSGVNNLSLHSSLDTKTVTGVYETKDIVPNIELIRQFSPQTHDIWILGDKSTTYESIEADIKNKILDFPKYSFHFLASKNIDDIINQLPHSPKSFVLLTTIGGWKDHQGNNLSVKESISRLKDNRNIIICAMEDAYVMDGVIGGYVTSGSEQGKNAAGLLIQYFNGKPVNLIHSITKSPNIYMFDAQALVHARLILSEYISRNAVVLHAKKTFFENNNNIIFNGLFILFVGFMIFTVIIYFIFKSKNSQLNELQSKYETLLLEYSSIKEAFTVLQKSCTNPNKEI
jgi:hypothetical protein